MVYTLLSDVQPCTPSRRREKEPIALLESMLPRDPGKRDLVILALIIVPLVVAGVIWGILGNFGETESTATPVPAVQEATPPATPSALFVIEAA